VEQGRPVIIALSHIGPLQASVLALLDLHRPVTFLLYRSLSGILPEGWELCFTDEKGSSRVQAFKRCREKLKAGLPVAIACDVFTREDVGVPVTVFDMELRIMRGFAALARSSGAMIVPVSIEWEGRNRLLFQAHPPLKSTDGDRSDREGFETAVLREYAAHIDQFMQTHSYELHPHRVELFLNAWNRLKGGGERKDPETMAPGVSTPKMTKYGAQENRIETR
jgi:lauroyl/myristoyl acyltransferase